MTRSVALSRLLKKMSETKQTEITLDPAFVALLKTYDMSQIDADNVIYGCFDDFKIGFFNARYLKFAEENSKMCDPDQLNRLQSSLGASLLDSVALVLHQFLKTNCAKVLAENRPWHHLYQCNSPSEFKLYHMEVIPLLPPQDSSSDKTTDRKGLLFIHSLVKTKPIDYDTGDLSAESSYRDKNGLVHQCVHCRRIQVQDAGQQDKYVWVTEWVAKPPAKTSHEICAVCYPFYYEPDADKFASAFPEAFCTGECE